MIEGNHGKAWGFRQGCRCDDCKLAWSRKNKSWELRSHRNGGRTTVDAAEVRAHLNLLLERMSQRAVGDLIGSSPGYVGRIARGDIQRVGVTRARSLLAIDPFAEVTGKARVSSVGAVNRLRALTALGYSTARLAAEIGYTATNVKALLRGERSEITGDADARIRREYERLSMRLPRPADEPDHQPSRPPAKCGTESGYRRHQRRHEAACDDCKAAKSAAGRRRYQRNKEKVA